MSDSPAIPETAAEREARRVREFLAGFGVSYSPERASMLGLYVHHKIALMEIRRAALQNVADALKMVMALDQIETDTATRDGARAACKRFGIDLPAGAVATPLPEPEAQPDA